MNLDHIKSKGGKIKKQYEYIPVASVEMTEAAAQSLAENPKIAYVEEDGKVQATDQVIPWGIPHVKATNVQQNGLTGSGIKVGILDTGIDYSHEDLKVSGGVTLVPGTTDYRDDNGHGTHVAGTIAALNNTVGALGVAPQVNLYAIKVLDQSGSGNYSDVVAGIEWAITNHMNILNMSLGGTSSSRTLKAAVDKAYNFEILLIASAGNNGYDPKGTITYPAAYDSVIAVGAVDPQNNRASFSSVGRQLELMAPGVGIESTVPGGYAVYSGTSMAAPHVTGVAALVWQAKPSLTNLQLRNTLNHTAVPLGDSFSYGNGLVDALAAVNYSETINTSGGGKKKL
ncbi:S8 family peptidase [Effusibacillus consociatus]|uniref:S8 family peptidase n=1 Tax=Effusibacillus consociatus TaxID=1117041 RepID=A0ABV9Q4N8_9BACL